MNARIVATSRDPKLHVMAVTDTSPGAHTGGNPRFKQQVSCNYVSRCMKPYTKFALSKMADVEGLKGTFCCKVD